MTTAHAVMFYDTDGDLAGEVADFLAHGLAIGEHVLMVGTPKHRAAVTADLVGRGLPLVAPDGHRQFVALDAADTLARFCVGGRVDPEAFLATVEPLIVEGLAAGRRVRIYGEMVALLWEKGNIAAALDLEACWNRLARTSTFSLLCGYRMGSLGHASLGEVDSVCELHAQVQPPRGYGEPRAMDHPAERDMRDPAPRRSETFLPLPAAVPAARRFVRDVLYSWGEPDAAWDAALIASELATNAVTHGDSPFRAILSRDDHTLRIEIQDAAPGSWGDPVTSVTDIGGRGVALVESIATSAGCEPLEDGKVAWAEIPTTGARRDGRGRTA